MIVTSQWTNPPSVLAAGLFLSSMECPALVTSAQILGELLNRAQYPEVLSPERELRLRKASGVTRARSSSLNAVMASWLCKQMLTEIDTPCDIERLAIFASSSSTVTASTIAFESRGLAEGWDSVDAMALPHTIPSSLASHIAMSIGSKGPALVNVEGFLGLVQSLELAGDYIQQNRGASALVVCAEEFSNAHVAVLNMAGLPSPTYAGAAAWLLGHDRKLNQPRIVKVVRGSTEDHKSDRQTQFSEVVLSVGEALGLGYVQSLELPIAVLSASFSSRPSQIIGRHAGRGWGSICVDCH